MTFAKRLRVFLVVALTALVAVASMTLYLQNVLQGNLDYHVLSSEKFGAPQTVLSHGFKVYYQDPAVAGWDGQFYYYIANDPFARRDTVPHIDSDAYRYQRIGLPLIAWIASKVAFRSWVSPLCYYLTNLALVLLATAVGGWYFQKRGDGAWPILLWSLSLGVLLSLLNGITDGAADALLIVSLVAHLSGRRVWYAVIATLAALTREAYVIFPVVIGAYDALHAIGWLDPAVRRKARLRDTTNALLLWLRRRAWFVLTPVSVFALWQLFLRLRFHIAPSQQAFDILALPLAAWFRYITQALGGTHPMFPAGLPGSLETISLGLFMLLLVSSAIASIAAWRRARPGDGMAPVAISVLALTALYACFGTTVMTHYHFYMKAAGVFFLATPFLWRSFERPGRTFLAVLLVATDGLTAYRLVHDLNLFGTMDYDRYTRSSQVANGRPMACRTDFHSRLQLLGIEELGNRSLVGAMLSDDVEVMRVAVTNLTQEPFGTTHAVGSVNVSYHWLAEDGKTVVVDGIRSFVPGGIAPGATAVVPVVVRMPQQPGHYILRLSLVQEGCAWFYNVQPDSKLDIDYVIH